MGSWSRQREQTTTTHPQLALSSKVFLLVLSNRQELDTQEQGVVLSLVMLSRKMRQLTHSTLSSLLYHL
jgi:hypothetical protein